MFAVVIAMSYAAWAVVGEIAAFGYYVTSFVIVWLLALEIRMHASIESTDRESKDQSQQSSKTRFKIVHLVAAISIVAVFAAIIRGLDSELVVFSAAYIAGIFLILPLIAAVVVAMDRQPTPIRSGFELLLSIALSTAPFALATSADKAFPEVCGVWLSLLMACTAATATTLLTSIALRWSGHRLAN